MIHDMEKSGMDTTGYEMRYRELSSTSKAGKDVAKVSGDLRYILTDESEVVDE